MAFGHFVVKDWVICRNSLPRIKMLESSVVLIGALMNSMGGRIMLPHACKYYNNDTGPYVVKHGSSTVATRVDGDRTVEDESFSYKTYVIVIPDC